MPKRAAIIALILSGLALLALLTLAFWHRSLELKQTRRTLADTQAALETNRHAVVALQKDLDVATQLAKTLEQQAQEIARNQQSLEQEMRHALESKDVTISELQGRLTVNILDRILFDSGEATLHPEGKAVLKKIAEVLGQFPQRQIQVVGHTDNVPIRATARTRYPSNWELSTARATAAVRYLTEEASIEPHRISAAGYGEFRPTADNATPEGRAANRRIAIVVLAEELVPSDTSPLGPLPPPQPGLTNPPPTPAGARVLTNLPGPTQPIPPTE